MSCFLPFSHALLSHSAHPFFQWLPRTRACDRPPTCWSSTWQRLTCCSSCFACLSLPSTTCCPSGPSESIGASLYVTLYAKKGVFLSPLMGSWQTSKQLRREAASRLLMPPFLLSFFVSTGPVHDRRHGTCQRVHTRPDVAGSVPGSGTSHHQHVHSYRAKCFTVSGFLSCSLARG